MGIHGLILVIDLSPLMPTVDYRPRYRSVTVALTDSKPRRPISAVPEKSAASSPAPVPEPAKPPKIEIKHVPSIKKENPSSTPQSVTSPDNAPVKTPPVPPPTPIPEPVKPPQFEKKPVRLQKKRPPPETPPQKKSSPRSPQPRRSLKKTPVKKTDPKSAPSTVSESLPRKKPPVQKPQAEKRLGHPGPRPSSPSAGSGSKQTRMEPDAADTDASKQGLQKAVPLYQYNPSPKYPRRALKRGWQGIVLLDVLVDRTGAVKGLRIARSSGFSILDQAASDAVNDWRFKPGMRDGETVEMWIRVPVRFQLD